MKTIKISKLILAGAFALGISSAALAEEKIGAVIKSSSKSEVSPKNESQPEKPVEARRLTMPVSTKFNVFCAIMEPDKKSPENESDRGGKGAICTLKLPVESTTAVCYPMPTSTETEKGFTCTVVK